MRSETALTYQVYVAPIIAMAGRERELGCGDVVAVGLQVLDDAAPAGAISPCAVDKHDVRSSIHLCGPFSVGLTAIMRSETEAGYP
jgi:hypothetical protein